MAINPAASSEAMTTEVGRVAIRVPQFWPDKPALWFCQVEGQFALNGITQDSTKFFYVMFQLDNRYAQEVEDILTNPPSEGKYDTLKKELIRRLSTSQEQRIQQLLEHEEIGDRTPSQFLCHLRNLAGTAVPDEFLRTLWLNRLPTSMRAILATQTDTPLNKTAELADKINESWSSSKEQPPTATATAGHTVVEVIREDGTMDVIVQNHQQDLDTVGITEYSATDLQSVPHAAHTSNSSRKTNKIDIKRGGKCRSHDEPLIYDRPDNEGKLPD
ncbi:hypothetical protein ANTRET_LOCUS2247 [Anthophora retusa]